MSETVQNTSHTIRCPRCFTEIPAADDVKFCPRCGFAGVASAAAADSTPHALRVDGRSFTVGSRLALGSLCNLYRCTFDDRGQRKGVFKIARDAVSNLRLEREARTLRQLTTVAPRSSEYTPFLPAVVHSFPHRGNAEPARFVNVLRYDDRITSPDELYSLDEVLAVYTAGIDARDMAWIWRRLLTILDFVHASSVAHGATLPMHILIEPREHKLVLIDWCHAILNPSSPVNSMASTALGRDYHWWVEREIARSGDGFTLDLSMAARSMIKLIGGDPTSGEFPASVDSAIARHLTRITELPPGKPPVAGRILRDFDQLIETLWGSKKFQVLEMPPRAKATH